MEHDNKNTRYGFFFDEEKEKDFIFGSRKLPDDILQPDADWREYLPKEESQVAFSRESFSCTVFTILNNIEILHRRLYNEEINLSDNFLATLAETQKNGGSNPRKVCDLLLDKGVPREHEFPFGEPFTREIPQEIYDFAKKFLEEYNFGYEKVPTENWETIREAAKRSPLLVSVYAWANPDGGSLFSRPEGARDSHATTGIYFPDTYYTVFDSYGNPFLKDCSLQMKPMQANRFWLEKKDSFPRVETPRRTPNTLKNFLRFLFPCYAK